MHFLKSCSHFLVHICNLRELRSGALMSLLFAESSECVPWQGELNREIISEGQDAGKEITAPSQSQNLIDFLRSKTVKFFPHQC